MTKKRVEIHPRFCLAKDVKVKLVKLRAFTLNLIQQLGLRLCLTVNCANFNLLP